MAVQAPNPLFTEPLQDPADIALLSRIVVLPRVVAGYGQGPASLAFLQLAKEPGRVIDIQVRVEHVGDGGKAFAVEVIIELHAADVYQLQACGPGCVEALDRLLFVERVNGVAFQVQCIGMEIAVDAGLGQPNREKIPSGT